MSKKATINARFVTKTLSKTNKAANNAKLMSESAKLSKDAVKAAVAAACAVERASVEQGLGSKGLTPLKGVAKDVRAAAEEAVERAREAIEAADRGNVAGAALAAERSARAAQRAGSLSAATSVLAETAKALAADAQLGQPAVTAKGEREETPREARERELAAFVSKSASYLVTYNRKIVATFAREEDAFLLESELAELDCEHGVASAMCEVLDRRTGNRLGGYMLTSGRIHVFLRDENREARFCRRRRMDGGACRA